MKKYWLRVLVFFILNFAALGIGSYFTGPGTSSEWYQNLNKAPWTPPGFVFGLAWTTIMICFSFFMASMSKGANQKILLSIFALQWLLNVLWNPLFFGLQWPTIALIDISLLFVTVGYFTVIGFKRNVIQGVLVLPYFIWLIIAISLNAYIVFNN
jgi:translocator protein